jgi:hypothetical protein
MLKIFYINCFGGFMTKKKLIQVCLSLFSLVLLIVILGCSSSSTKSNGGSSGSSPGTGDQAPHGQATINLMAQNVFAGSNLNTNYWAQLEGYCKAGPTQLIIADMGLVIEQFSRSIGPGRWESQMFALASTYAGVGWAPPGDPDADYYWTIQDQILAWWDRYINAVLGIMQKYPQTTALIITNDEPDRCGARLGLAIQNNLASVNNRVTLGDILDNWRKLSRGK